MMRETRKSKEPPCACCGNPSEVDCWQYRLCVKCHGLWAKDVEPPPDNARWSPDTNTAQAAWAKVTEAWLTKARAA